MAFVDHETFELSCDDVPLVGIDSFVTGGTITPQAVDATYTVGFPAGLDAEGVWSVART